MVPKITHDLGTSWPLTVEWVQDSKYQFISIVFLCVNIIIKKKRTVEILFKDSTQNLTYHPAFEIPVLYPKLYQIQMQASKMFKERIKCSKKEVIAQLIIV